MRAPTIASTPPNAEAQVLHFRCQFTRNLTQKKKRWNDGTLHFHTFNNLIRVTDDESAVVGRKHCQGSLLQDGDEITLDNDILVAVGEATGSTTTDLAPILHRRSKTPSQQPPATHVAETGPSHSTSPTSALARPRHRSLASMLGNRSVSQGKARLPPSPFTLRQQDDSNANDCEPPSKRLKTAATSHAQAWAITATTKTALQSPRPKEMRSNPAKAKPSSSKRVAAAKPVKGQQKLQIRTIVDLTSDSPPPEDHVANSLGYRSVIKDTAAIPNTPNAASRRAVTAAKSTRRLTSSPPVRAINLIAHTSRNSIEEDMDSEEPRRTAVPAPQSPKIKRINNIMSNQQVASSRLESLAGRAGIRQDAMAQIKLPRKKQKSRLLVAGNSAISGTSMFLLSQDNTILTSRLGQSAIQQSPAGQDHQSGHASDENLSSPLRTSHIPSTRPQFRRINSESAASSSAASLRGGEMVRPAFAPFREESGNDAAWSELRSRKGRTPLYRSLTLATEAQGQRGASPVETEVPEQVEDIGPWSREARDLFDWRPPDWEARIVQREPSAEMVD